MAKKDAYDVLVVGGDAAALVAALDCARIGLRVVVLAPPASAHRPTVFSHRAGIVASLLTELGVLFRVGESVGGASEADLSIAGIPANPFAPYVRERMGWRGAWRVYLDRIMPLLTIGAETNLGELVRRRLGQGAVTSLVDPALAELYGLTAEQTSVAAVIPGLSQAMTRAGSLTTGIIDLAVADPRVAQILEVEGGVATIEAALREHLEFFSARVVDVTGVALSLSKVTDSDGEESISFVAIAGEVSVLAHALLFNSADADLPDASPEGLWAEVGMSPRLPGLEAAVPASRAASAAIRRVLLSNPNRLPMGPADLQG